MTMSEINMAEVGNWGQKKLPMVFRLTSLAYGQENGRYNMDLGTGDNPGEEFHIIVSSDFPLDKTKMPKYTGGKVHVHGEDGTEIVIPCPKPPENISINKIANDLLVCVSEKVEGKTEAPCYAGFVNNERMTELVANIEASLNLGLDQDSKVEAVYSILEAGLTPPIDNDTLRKSVATLIEKMRTN